MANKLHLKGTQSLSLNPVMHYLIDLLTVSRLDLVEKIRNEVETNPMLEIETPEIETEPLETENDFARRLDRADSSFLNAYEDQGFFRRNDDAPDRNRILEQMTPGKTTFNDHLFQQAQVELKSEKEIEIARQIIFNLDGEGFLPLEIASIASQLETDGETIEKVRRIIMTLDPPGCASFNQRECLLAQIEALQPQRAEKLRLLVQNHLENLSQGKNDLVRKQLGLDETELARLLDDLKRLPTRPVISFSDNEIEYIVVDLLLLREEDEYKVYYIEESIPKVVLSAFYDEMTKKTSDRKTLAFLKERLRNAQFFIQSLELRKSTMLRIAEYLVKMQKDYLDFGEKWKKPLTMRDVARELNLNESTVSRSVSSKYMASSKGLISLKSLFSQGIRGDFGLSYSVSSVKEKIREIITAEPPAAPYADDVIAEKLAGLGVSLSRRAVRNYRDEMKIPSSYVRKKTNSGNQGGHT